MYKTIHGETPLYLQQTLPANVGNNARYALRNEHNFPEMRSRTSNFQNSFIPKTIHDWNKLDNGTKNAPSLESFQRKLAAPSPTVPKWFYSGKRTLSITHAKLRMLCSPLNDHLYSHIHVVDSPTCICGHTRENNKHFLLECPLYLNERSEMFIKLRQLGFDPSLTNILYGNTQYKDNVNIKAFEIIHEFLATTGRF